MNKFNSISEYIDGFEGDIKDRLNILRNIVYEVVPDCLEKISWNMPTFYYNENMVHFAVAKNHIGFYPTPSPIAFFSEELKDYKTSKGAIQFPNNRPIPYDLVKEIIKFRVDEINIKHNI